MDSGWIPRGLHEKEINHFIVLRVQRFWTWSSNFISVPLHEPKRLFKRRTPRHMTSSMWSAPAQGNLMSLGATYSHCEWTQWSPSRAGLSHVNTSKRRPCKTLLQLILANKSRFTSHYFPRWFGGCWGEGWLRGGWRICGSMAQTHQEDKEASTAQQKQLKTHRSNKVKVTLQEGETEGEGSKNQSWGRNHEQGGLPPGRSDVMQLQVHLQGRCFSISEAAGPQRSVWRPEQSLLIISSRSP